MFEIIRYKQEKFNDWNAFVKNSKNGTFLFDRNYMDYHSDRFADNSFMIYRKGKLYSLLPANRVDDSLYSHQGLTYGGMIMSNKVTASECLEMFSELNNVLKADGIKKVIYKPIPFIYHRCPAQEDLYALFRVTNSHIIGRNISSTIIQSDKIKFIESRKSGIRKARNNNIIATESDDYTSFWEILNNNLKGKYGVTAVHSLQEITLLKTRFPDNIKLYIAKQDEEVLGGTVLYITPNVVHTQYISANLKGKELGALDLIFDRLINNDFINFKYFDFGQSTEQMGRVLNEQLIFQKEGFGGRGMCYDIYEYDL